MFLIDYEVYFNNKLITSQQIGSKLFNRLMGNKQCVCFEDIETKSSLPSMQVNIKSSKPIQVVSIPKLLPAVQEHLLKTRPFQLQLPKNSVIQKIGNDVYKGQLSIKKKPQGYGTMYFKNGSVFVGSFQNGRANGPGHYVFPNGSYYHGRMVAGKANDINGQFHSEQLSYKGGFRENMFDGKAEQQGRGYQFKGTYTAHQKKQGILKWNQLEYNQNGEEISKKQLIYIGAFNQNGQFHGEGKLINELGQYRGTFVNGKKHGKGQFSFKSGIKYVGDYVNGIKQGTCTIFAKSQAIAFSGQIKNGLPNGRGYVLNSFGDKVNLNWIDGIDERELEKDKSVNSKDSNK